MDWIFFGLLFLHVIGAIIAFGPTYTFPFIGAAAGREPQHANFAVRVQESIAERVILPLALFQVITGLGLLWRLNFAPLSRLWLVVAIVLYVWALAQNLIILRPTVRRLVEATSGPPPAPVPGAPAPSGPPPHVAALVRRARIIGMLNVVLITIIVFLMVTKPF